MGTYDPHVACEVIRTKRNTPQRVTLCARWRKVGQRTCATCSAEAEFLCDNPAKRRKTGTCDRPICGRCALLVGPDRHLCPACARAAELTWWPALACGCAG